MWQLRLPSWSNGYTVKVSNNKVECEIINGYIYLNNIRKKRDFYIFRLNPELKMIKANKRVDMMLGKLL